MMTIQESGRRTTRILLVIVVLLSLLTSKLSGQPLELSEAYTLLEANYPVLRSVGLNDCILQTDLALLDLERKPTLYLRGSATVQSETTGFGDAAESLPISVDLPLYSARAYGEINYNITDGGRLAARERITAAEGKLANQRLEVERFGLRSRVNQLFLGVLLNRERIRLFETTLDDIAARKEALAAGVELGATLESELLQLRVREVEIAADRDDVRGNVGRLIANLSTLTGRRLAPDVELSLPGLPPLTSVPEIDRPELRLFDLQREAVLAGDDLIEANTKPIVSAFAQVGLGLPNPLNLFDNGVAPYAIGGLNFQWNFKDWGRSDLQRQQLQLRSDLLERQRETLLFNLNAGNEAYLADVRRLSNQLERDREVVDLQAEILDQLSAQLDNGVITAADYLTQANAELRARQQLKLHETELRQLQLNFLNERGGF